MSLKKKRILNVNDPGSVHYQLSEALSEDEFEIIEAHTGLMALELAAENPDLVLLDVNLPDISGFDVCRILKLYPHTNCIPVILITEKDKASENVKAESRDTGADRYIIRCIDQAELLETINSLLAIKEHEKTLRSNEEEYRIFMDATSDFAFLKDDSFRYLMTNRAFQGFTGKAPEEIKGRTDTEVMPQRFAEACRRSDSEVMDRKCIIIKKETFDGRTYETRKYPVTLKNGKIGVGGFIRDITESLRAEQTLRESESKFRGVFNNSPLGIAILNPDASIRETNSALQRITGFSNEEICGMGWKTRTHPDDLEESRAYLEKIIKGETDCYQLEKRYFIKNDDVIWVALTVSAVRDKSDTILYLIAIIEDITERRAAGNELVKLRESVEQCPVSIVITDINGNIEYVNPFFSTITGYSRDEAIGQNPRILKSGAQSKEFYSEMWKTLISGNTWRGEFLNSKKDKTPFWEESIISPIKDQKGKITNFVAIKQDITSRKELAAVLLESEERFRGAFETAPHGMAIVSKEGRWIKVNKALCEIVGYTEEELLVTDFQTITHPADLDADLAYVNQLLEGQIPYYQMEKRYIRKDGRIVWILLSVSIVRNALGALVHFVSQVQDITGRKEAETAKHYADMCTWLLLNLNTMENPSVEALADYAINGATLLTGSEFGLFASVDQDCDKMKIISLSEQTLSKCTIKDSCMEYNISNFGFLAEILKNITPVIINDYMGQNFKGHKFPEGHVNIERFMAVPLLHKNEVIAVIAVANRKEEYEKFETTHLGRFLEGAWRAIQHRIDEDLVKKAKEEAEKANAAKSEFLANMSHEIRTPMNAIVGMGHLLRQTVLNSKQQAMMTKIQSASSSLLGIIDKILDFSKIEAGRIELESIPFDIGEVIEKVSGMVSLQTEKKNVEVLVDFPPDLSFLVIGDPLRFEQVLVNLGSNALKFTDSGEVVFRATCLTEDEDSVTVLFSISDTGIGMSQDQAEKLFKPFSQGDSSTTRRFGGTGLGLVISKAFVELMGGEIYVKSEPDKGSVFSFIINFIKQPEAKRQKISLPESLKNLRILIVHKNRSFCEIIGRLMTSLSFQFKSVFSGEDAIKELEKSCNTGALYDAVLLDLNLAGMDGIEIAREIGINLDPKKQPKIILTTAFAKKEIIETAKKAGVSELIVKPVTYAVFLNIIKDLFGETKESEMKNETGGYIKEKYFAELSGARVLLVEDQTLNLEVAQGILSKAGIISEVAENGKEAVRMIIDEGRIYDAVLMDLQMPVMDGYEATRLIREKISAKQLPIIAMTANAIKAERGKCLASGMNEYVTKPVDVKTLYEVLARIIKKNGSEETIIGSTVAAYDNNTLSEVLPGIDIKEAYERFDGDLSFISKLIISFKEKYAGAPAKLADMLNSGDLESVRFLAHGLKGAAGYISAHEVAAIARKIESAISEKSPKLNASASTELEVAMEQINISAAILASMPRQTKVKLPFSPGAMIVSGDYPEPMEDIICSLKSSLESSEFRARDFFAEVRHRFYGIGVDIYTEELEKALDSLDFEKGIKALDEIKHVIAASKEKEGAND